MSRWACKWFLVLAALNIGAANAQDYNPSSEASQAPGSGLLRVQSSPNGTQYLNSLLGLTPSFFSNATGVINPAYTGVGAYLPLTGGTISGPIVGAYYAPQCYTVAALKALPAPTTVAYACYFDPNNTNKPNLAVYALGAWRYLPLGSTL